MKKIAILCLVFCLCCSLAACSADRPLSFLFNPLSLGEFLGTMLGGIPQPESPESPENPENPESPESPESPDPKPADPENTGSGTAEPDVPQPEEEKMTLDSFLDKMVGIWIIDSTVQRYSESGVSFDLLVISKSQCTSGCYPGELFGAGQYQNFTEVDKNTYKIDLLYEEGYGTMTFRFTANGALEVKYGNGDYYAITYGGNSFENAAAVACRLVPYIAPAEPETTVLDQVYVVAEYPGYRVIREEHSYCSDGEVLISQYWDYVELTANTAAAKKINEALKPGKNAFLSDEELEASVDGASADFPYKNEQTSVVTYSNDRWLCVNTSYLWFMGGVNNYGDSSVVFDISSGEQVTLRAFAGSDPAAFEAQLKKIVWNQIKDDGPWESAFDTLSGYTLDTFNFAINDGQILLFFPQYEFFAGAYGPVTVETGIYIE